MHDGTLRKLRATNAPAKVRLSRGHRWLRRHRNVPAMPNLQVVVYSRLRGSESKEVIGYRRRPGQRFRSIDRIPFRLPPRFFPSPAERAQTQPRGAHCAQMRRYVMLDMRMTDKMSEEKWYLLAAHAVPTFAPRYGHARTRAPAFKPSLDVCHSHGASRGHSSMLSMVYSKYSHKLL